MSVELKEVRQRIGTIRQIRRVTSTLQRVAAARLQQQRLAVLALDRYRARLAEALAAVLHGTPPRAHPLLRAPRGGVPCLVVFGADRGLCGGYVANLMDSLRTYMLRQGVENARILAVGRIAARRARRQGWTVARMFPQPPAPKGTRDGGPPECPAGIHAVAQAALDGFLRGEYCDVRLVFTEFQTLLAQQPTVNLLLPLSGAVARESGLHRAIFEPAAEDILARLLPEYLAQSVFSAFFHSAAAENAARQVAMGRATENAGEMLEGLVADFRRLRQESITTEMIELFGGNLEKPEETQGAPGHEAGAPRHAPLHNRGSEALRDNV